MEMILSNGMSFELEIGSEVYVEDKESSDADKDGHVCGTVTSFNHEGLPMVDFGHGPVVVFPDMMV
jgi:hypothetical protein